MKKTMDYWNKNILAPMVRIGTLPTRLLALDYGADLVYSEEIIDHKMLQCTRKENALLNTVDFVHKDGTVVFRTCEKEKEKVVFQMGTANAQRALKVAKMIEHDVAAIDINMGCPKEFSLKGGMGAALLSQPDKIKDILTTLVEGLTIPVTCKIRILPTIEESLSLVKLIQSTGVQALGVHGRLKEERPRHDNHNDVIKVISEALTIPVIANGGSKEIQCFNDIQKFKCSTGCSSMMLARAAQWNPSIFCSTGLLPVDDVIKHYLKYAVQFDNETSNTKYCVQQILHKELDTERGRSFQASGLMLEICELFGVGEEYRITIEARIQKQKELARLLGMRSDGFTTTVTPDGEEVLQLEVIFNKKEYDVQITPKSILYEYCQTKKWPKPVYKTIEDADRTYTSVVIVDKQRFTSSHRGISKKFSEQSAAIACLRYLGVDDGKKEHLLQNSRKEQIVFKNTENNKRFNNEPSESTSGDGSKRTRQENEITVCEDIASKPATTNKEQTESNNSLTNITDKTTDHGKTIEDSISTVNSRVIDS